MNSQTRRTPTQKERRRSLKLLRRMVLGLRARLDDELRPSQVTAAQLRVLYEIQQNPGITGAQIARTCSVTPQSAQAMMALAVKHGWVIRGRDPGNHRLVTARLTAIGERLLVQADITMIRIEAKVWAGTPMAELQQLNRILERGLLNLDQ